MHSMLVFALCATLAADVTWRNLSVQRPPPVLIETDEWRRARGQRDSGAGRERRGQVDVLRALVNAAPRGRATSSGNVQAAGTKLKGLRDGDAAY